MSQNMTTFMTHNSSPKASIPSLLNKPSQPPRLPLPSLMSESQRNSNFAPHSALPARLPGPHVLPPMQPQYHYVPQLRASSVSGPHISPPQEHFRTYQEYAPPATQEFAYVQVSELPNGTQIGPRPTYVVSSALNVPGVPLQAPVAHYPVYQQVATNQQQPQYQHHQQPLSNPQQQAANPRKHRRFRRRYYQIVRRYKCTFPGCTKRYGSLNHLNTHIVTKKHGTRKSKADFKDILDSDGENKEEEKEGKPAAPPLTPPISTTESKTPEVSEKNGDSNVLAKKSAKVVSLPTPQVSQAHLPRMSDILDGPVKLPSLPSVVGFSP